MLAGHWNKVRGSVLTLLQSCHRDGVRTPPVIGDRAERIAVAAARQADLPERGSEYGTHPNGLLAMLGALQRVGHHDERAATMKPVRQRLYCLDLDAGD